MEVNTLLNAINGAFAKQGKNKGKLLSKCPPMGTLEAAAWQAIMMHANPHKVGFGHMFFMGDDAKELFDVVYNSLVGFDCRNLDRDASVLKELFNN